MSAHTPLEMSADDFRKLGHALVEEIARFHAGIGERPVTADTPPEEIRACIGEDALPAVGAPADALLAQISRVLFDHSLHNGHPRFMGYITSSAAPLGALADLLAAAVNANVGLWQLAPVATEIEAQTIGWLAELIGYPPSCGGLMVSGGNMANLIGFFAARRAKTPWDIRAHGVYGDARRLTVYASRETHTWIEKAVELSGLGMASLRHVPADSEQRMRVDALEARIAADRDAGHLPFLVVGAAGTVSTGAVDPLDEIADVCRRQSLWFHVDGAYGAPAACLPEAPKALRGLALADSIALDPHKWLYCPLEAGCALVRDPQHLLDAYSFRPAYYRFDAPDSGARSGDVKINYYEHGIQNSRGFRALKVWLVLKTLGRDAYVECIRRDMALARALFDAAAAAPELQARTCNLSLTTLRYVPEELASGDGNRDEEEVRGYLNTLNEALVAQLQKSGEAFLSNAVVDGDYVLRACIVNFRTTPADITAIVETIVRLGRELHAQMRHSAPAG